MPVSSVTVSHVWEPVGKLGGFFKTQITFASVHTHSPDKCTPIYIDIIPKYSTLAFDLKNKCKSINWQERGGIQKEAMKGSSLNFGMTYYRTKSS